MSTQYLPAPDIPFNIRPNQVIKITRYKLKPEISNSILKIHFFFIESGLKIIQFKTRSQIFIQTSQE